MATATTCRVCELHAESIFKIEGMDCHEEVAILERSLRPLTGLEALDADVMGGRRRPARRVGGGGVRRVSLRPGTASRDEGDGARAGRDCRADGAGAARSAR